jgi:hypothetical protein
MSAIVLEHVPVEELPSQWRLRLAATSGQHVTVRIEPENSPPAPVVPLSTNPMFGLWKERADIADVDGYMSDVRAARYPANTLPSERSE